MTNDYILSRKKDDNRKCIWQHPKGHILMGTWPKWKRKKKNIFEDTNKLWPPKNDSY
jgi:hypothetical protein